MPNVLKTELLTINEANDTTLAERDFDFFGNGAHGWLISHITWALTNGYSVQIRPLKKVELSTESELTS